METVRIAFTGPEALQQALICGDVLEGCKGLSARVERDSATLVVVFDPCDNPDQWAQARIALFKTIAASYSPSGVI